MELYKEELADGFNIFNGFTQSIENTMYYIKENNIVVGMIEIWTNIPNVKYRFINMIIFKEYRHKGYAKEALNLLDYILEDLNIHKLIFKSSTQNPKEFLKKIGFIQNTEYLYSEYLYEKELKYNLIKKEA